MPVPSDIADLSQTAGNNSPPGSESPSTADDYLRAQAAFIAMLRDGVGFSEEADVASAATCSIGAVNSMLVRITGTTTITSFGTTYNGPRFIRFADALTLTHNASTLILPGGANITTAAGDTCIATPISGGWVVSNYVAAAGGVQVASSAEVQAGTNATKIVTPATLVTRLLTAHTVRALSGASSTDFVSIPSWVQRITISISGLSLNGTATPIVRLGTSGGVETTGYSGSVALVADSSTTSASSFNTGFPLGTSTGAGIFYTGALTLTLLNASTNTWIISGTLARTDTTAGTFIGGSKSLSGTLDRVRLANTGTDLFDAGTVNILYE